MVLFSMMWPFLADNKTTNAWVHFSELLFTQTKTDGPKSQISKHSDPMTLVQTLLNKNKIWSSQRSSSLSLLTFVKQLERFIICLCNIYWDLIRWLAGEENIAVVLLTIVCILEITGASRRLTHGWHNSDTTTDVFRERVAFFYLYTVVTRSTISILKQKVCAIIIRHYFNPRVGFNVKIHCTLSPCTCDVEYTLSAAGCIDG